ncbi:MAG: hypothetical protein WDO68_15535 [Gammaproteobacteria bacterium]
MSMANGTDGNKRRLGSLGELSRNVAPPRDLWPAIASQISTNALPAPEPRSHFRPTGMQWAALAAVVAALAVGIWLGRSVLPAGSSAVGAEALDRRAAQTESPAPGQGGLVLGRPATEGLLAASQATGSPATGAVANGTPAVDPNTLQASLVTDPRYTMQRASLIRGLEAQLSTLPPDTQHKVASSLTTIRQSIQDLQEAIGRDPANALLQELLVNSYQDEMRVLTAVHEAGGASGGI